MTNQGSTTRRRLELALHRLQRTTLQAESGSRLSIAAVAREAGVSNATIHNRYPDIAARIRRLQLTPGRRRAKTPIDSTDALQRRYMNAKTEIDELKAALAKSLSINLRIAKENELLRSRLKNNR
ncbi:TetR family transcriptional regulator [Paraburkholderia strydomiana]|uniref:TetR family transcriptional regulator n=1 Tax=Paraburkholderia strydomiana TaxID=1245417 RepID=UPI0038BCEA13